MLPLPLATELWLHIRDTPLATPLLSPSQYRLIPHTHTHTPKARLLLTHRQASVTISLRRLALPLLAIVTPLAQRLPLANATYVAAGVTADIDKATYGAATPPLRHAIQRHAIVTAKRRLIWRHTSATCCALFAGWRHTLHTLLRPPQQPPRPKHATIQPQATATLLRCRYRDNIHCHATSRLLPIY